MANGNRGLPGLLADPQFNTGIGLLAGVLGNPATTTEAVRPGLLLGQQAISGRDALLRNQVQREKLLQSQRRRQGGQELRGLLEGGADLASPQVRGLLAEIAPQALAQGTFGQERAEPAAVRTLRAAGIDPASPEGREVLLNSLTRQGATDEMLRAFDLQLKAFTLDEQRRKRQETEDTQAKERRGLETSTRKAVRDLLEFGDLNDRLSSTFLQTGVAGSDLRRLGGSVVAEALEAAGRDASGIRSTITDFDRFKKLSADLAIEALDRLRGTGAIQTSRFETLRDSLANVGTSTGANRLLIADALQAVLDGAAVENIPVPNRAEIERRIQELRKRPEEDTPPPRRGGQPRQRRLRFDDQGNPVR